MKAGQDEIRSWWQENPMTYDWHGTSPYPEMGQDYFQEIDRRFFSSAWFAQQEGQKPFSGLIDYAALRGKNVLEIGCGSGAHARLLAESGCCLTAIDMTPRAVALTRRRLQLWGLKAEVLEADAERLPFPDESFDAVWSWGVIHHSAKMENALQEIRRVLRPGGQISIMVYHRSSFTYWLNFFLVRGVLMGNLLTMNMEEVCNKYSDGAVARHFTRPELCALMANYFQQGKVQVFGQVEELLPLPGFVRDPVTKMIPTALQRSLLRRWGHFLFITGVKAR